jgi:hypothetical protein
MDSPVIAGMEGGNDPLPTVLDCDESTVSDWPGRSRTSDGGFRKSRRRPRPGRRTAAAHRKGPAPTTPSAHLTPAVRAQENLGWCIGIEAYTFHKYTFFEAIEKTAELGLPYIGGLSFMQHVSKDIPKNFDQILSDDELLQIRMKLESAGVRMPVYYAQTIPSDEAACRKLFEFGNKMGVETFICEPKAEQLDLLDKLAKCIGFFNATTLELANKP